MSYYLRGSYSKVPEMRWVITSRNLLLPVLEAASLRAGSQHSEVRALLRGADFLMCPHVAEGARHLSGVSFMRALITIQFVKVPPI